MTDPAPDVAAALDCVVARARDLPSPLRSISFETDGSTDWRLFQRASDRGFGNLVPPPGLPADAVQERIEHHARTWIAFDADAVDGGLTRWRIEIERTDVDGTQSRTTSGCDARALWGDDGDRAEWFERPRSMTHATGDWVVRSTWTDDDVARVRSADSVDVLGRPCVRVHVTPPRPRWGLWPLVYGDEHQLDVDVETGLTLAVTSLHDGEVFQHHQVVALELDPVVDQVLTAPPSHTRPVEPQTTGRTTHRDPSGLAAAVTAFAVLAPTRLPEGYAFLTGHEYGDEDDGSTRVHLAYIHEGYVPLTFNETAAPSGLLGAFDGWSHVEHGDLTVIVSDVTDTLGNRVAGLTVDGVDVQVAGCLTVGELLDLVSSLEPVRH